MEDNKTIKNIFNPYLYLEFDEFVKKFKFNLIGNGGVLENINCKYNENYIIFTILNIDKNELEGIETRWNKLNEDDNNEYSFYYGHVKTSDGRIVFISGPKHVNMLDISSYTYEVLKYNNNNNSNDDDDNNEQLFRINENCYGFLPINSSKFNKYLLNL